MIGHLIEDAGENKETDNISADPPREAIQHDMGPPPPRIKLAEVKSLLESEEADGDSSRDPK